MKKLTFPLLATLLAFGSVQAQSPYNKWSIDVNGGIAKPARAGNSAETFENLHLDGGVRYSLNNKFGVKASFGYDKLNNWVNNTDINTNYYRTSLEGVVNLGRVLNFENWTRTLNVQAHAGGGYSWMNSDSFSGNDNMGHLMAGLTGQVKLHKRIALNADFTVIQNIEQNRTWDGTAITNRTIAQGTMFNASVGLSIYLGKQAQHADWYVEEDRVNELLDNLDSRMSKVENMLVDTDGDGIPDYLDLEQDTPEGAIVDSKGRNIDKNNNGIADNIEEYIAEKYGDNQNISNTDAKMIKELINKGYVAAYFDFDKAQPNNVEGTNFIVNYLKNNPTATIEVLGYADAVGNKDYNVKLSERRAIAVKDILVKAGIDASRVSAKGNGIDDSSKNSTARKIARKAVFQIK